MEYHGSDRYLTEFLLAECFSLGGTFLACRWCVGVPHHHHLHHHHPPLKQFKHVKQHLNIAQSSDWLTDRQYNFRSYDAGMYEGKKKLECLFFFSSTQPTLLWKGRSSPRKPISSVCSFEQKTKLHRLAQLDNVNMYPSPGFWFHRLLPEWSGLTPVGTSQ